MTRPAVDWSALTEKAKRMSSADCLAAGRAAEALRRGGALACNAKDSGFYSDESSVYRAELQTRGLAW